MVLEPTIEEKEVGYGCEGEIEDGSTEEGEDVKGDALAEYAIPR